MNEKVLVAAFWVGLLPSIASVAADTLAGRRPNVVFILTDDQGYGDLSAHDNPILRTPHLDRLHSRSVRFTDFQVSPTCAPTRACLLTGRHEFRNGVTHTIFERERLTLDAVTLFEVLRATGYATGIFGKWHLGDEDAYQPDRRGFDEVFIHGGGGIGQTYPGSCGDAPGNRYFDPVIWHNGVFEQTDGYCTDVFFDQAIRWIDSVRSRDQPFIAYIPTNAPHSPYVCKSDDSDRYAGLGLAADTQNFFGMLHNLDQNVGRLIDQLAAWRIDEETLVIFMNDNGGTAGTSVFNAGMRGGKGTAFRGGTRAISLWSWPGALAPADCDALAAHIDLFPTLAGLAGVNLDETLQAQIEGRSLLPLLEDPRSAWQDRELFTHLGRWEYRQDPNESKYRMAAVRNQRWSLVSVSGGRTSNWELFDLQQDPSQSHNVIGRHAGVAQDLADAFDRWWEDCLTAMVNESATGPRINPFQSRYYAQFGGQPTAEYRDTMSSLIDGKTDPPGIDRR